ncbi:DUF6907 domain-containing protein [Streptomyces sp. NPDC056738]|uniref:DUF6907 domain-containing protein n=1 Tax=Streptomyces sp. NPDC056738 TaxID=3345933 RepID=UPI003695CFCD
MTATPPAFGPTETFPCDENSTPFAAVTLSFTVTREQLRAALAIGQAEQAGEPPLPELTVVDTRRQVEGYFAAAAVIESERELQAVNARLTPDMAAQLDAVIDRAYTRAERPDPPRQDPRYSEGTVTVQTLDSGEVTVPEPAWCLGHDDENVSYLADLTHNGARTTAPLVTAKYGLAQIMHAYISHAPHAQQQPEPKPLLSFLLDGHGDLDPADGHNLARALRVAAVRIERMATDLDHLRGEGQ